ncbi:MAG: response regulator [Acidobacteriota bacterium]|nr:response regulator [Acidobacteriota bacterium]
MSIKVLLADDSDIMRRAIRGLLQDEPRIELVAEAVSFAQAMQMIADFKPEILLMDLHLPEKRDFTPAFVKSQLRSLHLLAISVSNDEEAKELAASYGALALLDKMKLFAELIPAVIKFAAGASAMALTDTHLAPPTSLQQRSSLIPAIHNKLH